MFVGPLPALAAKAPAKGSKLFIIQDPESTKHTRMMRCVKGEGLPRMKFPTENGNLFIVFTIEFPESVDPSKAPELLKLLGPPKHVPKTAEDDDDVELVELSEMDPVMSYKEYSPPEGDDDDDEGGGGPGGQRVQCAQQ